MNRFMASPHCIIVSWIISIVPLFELPSLASSPGNGMSSDPSSHSILVNYGDHATSAAPSESSLQLIEHHLEQLEASFEPLNIVDDAGHFQMQLVAFDHQG
jgi:hypothetical protein